MARKSPIAFIYAQIKADNPSLKRFLTETNCVADIPTPLTGDDSGCNTSVNVTGVSGNGFRDSAIFKYNRVGLADIIAASQTGNTTNVVPNANQATLADMVASFNTAYGSNLQTSDLVNASVSQLTGGYFGLTLTPVNDHYLFNAGVELKYKGTFVALSLSGRFNAIATNGTPYTSALTISGGSGTYTNPRVIAGALPAGFVLSVSDHQVILSGNPGTVGATDVFTVAVDSDDGQTATSVSQTVRSNGGGFPNLSTDWVNVNPAGLTVTDLKATA